MFRSRNKKSRYWHPDSTNCAVHMKRRLVDRFLQMGPLKRHYQLANPGI